VRAILIALPVFLVFALGWLGGRLTAPRDITRSDMKKLKAADGLIDDLSVMASEHSTLGDPFATLALDKIVNYRKVRL
jgi:hypothetical protein